MQLPGVGGRVDGVGAALVLGGFDLACWGGFWCFGFFARAEWALC